MTLAIFLLLIGCVPAMKIKIDEDSEPFNPTFTFSHSIGRLTVSHTEGDKPKYIWQIVEIVRKTDVRKAKYGQVPKGFREEMPLFPLLPNIVYQAWAGNGRFGRILFIIEERANGYQIREINQSGWLRGCLDGCL